MPALPARRYPPIFSRFLRISEPPELGDARLAANHYKRSSLRAAFDAGWYAHGRVDPGTLGAGAGLLSNLGAAAFRTGLQARGDHERRMLRGGEPHAP